MSQIKMGGSFPVNRQLIFIFIIVCKFTLWLAMYIQNVEVGSS